MELRKHIGHRRFLLLAVFMILLSGVLFFRDYQKECITKKQTKWQEQEEIYQKHYTSYVNSIINENKALSRISIFAKKNSNAAKRSAIAKKKYKAVQKVTLAPSHGEALEKIFRLQSVHGLLLLVMIVLTLGFLDHDRQSLALIVASTPKGRSILAIKRIGVLLIVSLGLHLITYTLLLGEGILMFGMPKFNVAAQSLSFLKDMTLPVSLGTFFILYILICSACLALLSLFFWNCLIAFQTRSLGLALFLGIFGVEVILQKNLIPQSPFAILKYNNLYNLLIPMDLLCSFITYTFFKQMLDGQKIFLIVASILTIVMITISIIYSTSHRVLSQSHSYKLKKGIQKLTKRIRSHLSLRSPFFQECYKVLVCQKGLLYIACFLVLLVGLQDTTPYLANDTMNTYQKLYAKYGGPYDGRIMKEYIIPTHKKYEKTKKNYDHISDLYKKGKVSYDRLNGEEILFIAASHDDDIASTIEAQIKEIQALSKKGVKAHLIDQRSWTILLYKDGHYPGEGYYTQEVEGTLCMALMCFLFGSLWYYDRNNKMNLIIRTTSQGRDYLFKIRMKMIVMFAFMALLCTQVMDFYVLSKTYPLTSWKAPIRSLLFLKDLPINMPIWCFLIILTLLRILSLLAICMIINSLLMFIGGMKGSLLCFGLFVIPQVLSLLGISYFHYMSAIQLITIIRMEQELGFHFTLWIFIALYSGGILVTYLTKQMWNGKKGKIVWSS